MELIALQIAEVQPVFWRFMLHHGRNSTVVMQFAGSLQMEMLSEGLLSFKYRFVRNRSEPGGAYLAL